MKNQKDTKHGRTSRRNQNRDVVPRNEREQYARERALSVIALMRREKISLRMASKLEGTTPETVHKYAAPALKRAGARGIFQATKFDRLQRDVNFLTHDGYQQVTVYDSRIASTISQYMNALRNYLNDRRPSDLAKFVGKSFEVNGEKFTFITDPVVLNRLADAGVPYTDGFYQAVQGGAKWSIKIRQRRTFIALDGRTVLNMPILLAYFAAIRIWKRSRESPPFGSGEMESKFITPLAGSETRNLRYRSASTVTVVLPKDWPLRVFRWFVNPNEMNG